MTSRHRSRPCLGVAFAGTVRARIAATLLAAVVALAAAAVSAHAQERVGIAAAVNGTVDYTAFDATSAVAASTGQNLFLNDSVSSAAQSGMQMLLLDESVFTLGPQSDLTIDRYVYDPDAGAAALGASMTRGAFRFVSGAISDLDSREVELQTPSATIGVRGTIVGVLARPDEVTVLLLGPGRHNNASERRGAVVVRNSQGSVELLRNNFAVTVRAGEAPGEPFEIDSELIAAFYAQLQPEAPQTQQANAARGPAEPIAASGLPTVAGVSNEAVSARILEAQSVGDELVVETAETADFIGQTATLPATTSYTSLAQFRRLPVDVLNFSQSGIPLNDGGSYDIVTRFIVSSESIDTRIDFTSPTAGSGFMQYASPITVDGTVQFDSPLGPTTGPFNITSGDALSETSVFRNFWFRNTCAANVRCINRWSLLNQGSDIAQLFRHQLELYNLTTGDFITSGQGQTSRTGSPGS
jgi:hypothetical protein